jgi:multiple sugar transport system substrate-binding protein
MCLAWSGCKSGQERSAHATASGPLRLQIVADSPEIDAYKALIAAFQASAPDVKVELIPVASQKDHMAGLAASLPAGDPPDLFLINFRRYGQFAAEGVLEPLGPRLIERGRFREEDFYEPAIEAFRHDGTLVCAPRNVSSLVVYYNRKLFEEAGLPLPGDAWTWAEFLDAAKALTRDTNYGLGFEPTLIRLAPFVWQAGGDLVDDLHRPTRFMLDEPKAREALDFVRSWHATHKVVPPLIENESEDLESRFARGGLGMFLESRRYTAALRTVSGLDWDVAPLPRHEKAATVLHADAYCMAKRSKLKDAAYRFLEFALDTEGAGIISRSGRIVPTRKTVAEGPDFLDPNAPPRSARIFIDSIANVRRTPSIAAWNEIETRADPLVEEWFFSAAPPRKSLGQNLGEATQELFEKPIR